MGKNTHNLNLETASLSPIDKRLSLSIRGGEKHYGCPYLEAFFFLIGIIGLGKAWYLFQKIDRVTAILMTTHLPPDQAVEEALRNLTDYASLSGTIGAIGMCGCFDILISYHGGRPSLKSGPDAINQRLKLS